MTSSSKEKGARQRNKKPKKQEHNSLHDVGHDGRTGHRQSGTVQGNAAGTEDGDHEAKDEHGGGVDGRLTQHELQTRLVQRPGLF